MCVWGRKWWEFEFVIMFFFCIFLVFFGFLKKFCDFVTNCLSVAVFFCRFSFHSCISAAFLICYTFLYVFLCFGCVYKNAKNKKKKKTEKKNIVVCTCNVCVLTIKLNIEGWKLKFVRFIKTNETINHCIFLHTLCFLRIDCIPLNFFLCSLKIWSVLL